MIIPKPQRIEIREGKFDLRSLKSVALGDELRGILPIIKETLTEKIGVNLSDKDALPRLQIFLDNSIAPEGYEMKISKDGIDVKAGGKNGALYAVQTLRAAVKADAKTPLCTADFCEISDAPARSYRGLLIDTARYFRSLEHIKKIIDLMLLHKMNVLHLHLTDDQGWRVEIKKYPLLTEIGSKREKTHIGGWKNKNDPDDGKPHSGFYTQDELKNLVAYAADRGIQIIPEIDMPAHFAAAFAAYPHLGCRDKKVSVPWFFGGHYPSTHGESDWNRSACVGKETTYQFIFDIIDEIFEIFPAPYFHIGGDEAPKDEWEKCPSCQKLMNEEGIGDTKELQRYFIRRINAYVKSKGKNLIAWNEALEGGNADAEMIAQYWTMKKDPNVGEFLKKGGKILISKHNPFYLDMPFAQYPLKNIYKFKPSALVGEEHIGQIAGVEATLFGEWLNSDEVLEFRLLPRLAAVAEVCWNDERGDYAEFLSRVRDFCGIYEGLGFNYARIEIADPKNPIKRLLTQYEFLYKDPNKEFKENEKLK
jgi:hexosaminidase